MPDAGAPWISSSFCFVCFGFLRWHEMPMPPKEQGASPALACLSNSLHPLPRAAESCNRRTAPTNASIGPNRPETPAYAMQHPIQSIHPSTQCVAHPLPGCRGIACHCQERLMGQRPSPLTKLVAYRTQACACFRACLLFATTAGDSALPTSTNCQDAPSHVTLGLSTSWGPPPVAMQGEPSAAQELTPDGPRISMSGQGQAGQALGRFKCLRPAGTHLAEGQTQEKRAAGWLPLFSSRQPLPPASQRCGYLQRSLGTHGPASSHVFFKGTCHTRLWTVAAVV